MRCLGCSKSLLLGTAKRRMLSNRSSKDVFSVFAEIVERRFPGVKLTEGSFLCQVCFRRVEGILKLRRQLAEKERFIENGLDYSTLTSDGGSNENASIPAPSSSMSAVCTPPRATTPNRASNVCTPPRPQRGNGRHQVASGGTPRRRRLRIDTPVRHAVRRLQPAASPIVAVSFNIAM